MEKENLRKTPTTKKSVHIRLTAREWEKLKDMSHNDMRTVGPHISWILKGYIRNAEKFKKPGS